MVDPCDDVGEGGTTITNECQGARSGLVRAYREILRFFLPRHVRRVGVSPLSLSGLLSESWLVGGGGGPVTRASQIPNSTPLFLADGQVKR